MVIEVVKRVVKRVVLEDGHFVRIAFPRFRNIGGDHGHRELNRKGGSLSRPISAVTASKDLTCTNCRRTQPYFRKIRLGFLQPLYVNALAEK